jgi:rhamnulokinase
MKRAFRALAVDIGASNGRAILGELAADGRLSMREVRRFPNAMKEVEGSLRWDFDGLAGEVKAAVRDAAASGAKPASVGIDTWGVDYVLFDREGRVVEQPFAYRDRRTDGMMERFLRDAMPPSDVYAVTGIQFMQINTLYQLYSEVVSGSERLRRADALLMTPDALAFTLSGERRAEYTIASTSQMLDAMARGWSERIVEAMGLERRLLPEVVEPGTRAGAFRTEGGDEVAVVMPAGHDTAAAVAAVPAGEGRPWAYVSSGTWSLVGVETRAPVLTEDARHAGVTNEGGVEGTYRLLSNVMGLWLVQECQRMWAKGGREVGIEEVVKAAREAPSEGPLVDPDDGAFLSPPDMIEAIAEYCRRTGQTPPEDVGAAARSVFESLALKTAVVLDRIAGLTGAKPEVVHVVGGGSRNELLCRMTADAAGVPVVAGPAEATATGNLLLQAVAAGELGSLADLRAVVRKSFSPVRYEPSGAAEWDALRERFRVLVAGG